METLKILEAPIEAQKSFEFNPSSSTPIFESGTVIIYDEAIDGDLPQSASDSPVFALGVGKNTFTGETTFSNNESIDSDFDSFAFSIPAGTSLESISINISLLPVGSGIFSNTGYSLQDSLFNDISSESITIPSADLSLFNTDLPLDTGQFAINQNFLSGSLAPGEFRTAAYTFSLEVEGEADGVVNKAVFSGTGDITGIVETFRDVVDMGGVNNGNEIGSQGDGFREINWDGGAVPFNMPGNFFNNQNPPVNGLPRGVEFSTASEVSLFGVSNPVLSADPFFGDNEFDTINPTYPDQFTTFSSPRLFAPLDLNFMDVDFFEPGVFDANGDPVPALVKGFGAIFTDVDLPESTKLEFFDKKNNLLFSQFVEPDPQGLSFLGVAFDEPVVSKVRITSGNAPLNLGLDDDPFGTGVDVVAMDNFIYGEPLIDDDDIVIDQSNDDFEPSLFQSIPIFSPIGQEFVPEFNSLNVVELFTSDFNSGAETLLVNVREGDIFGPIVGTSDSVVASDFDGVTRFNFEEIVPLNPGETYVIDVVLESGSNWGIGSSGGPFSTYPDGNQILNGEPQPNNDLWFREGLLV